MTSLPIALPPPIAELRPSSVPPGEAAPGQPADRIATVPQLLPPAPIVRRVIAVLVDSPVYALPTIGVQMADAGAVLGIGAIWLYFCLCEGLIGCSFGKLVAGLRVYQVSGEPIGLGHAARRAVPKALYLIGLPLLADAILASVHPRRRSLGDLLAGTIVSRKVKTLTLDYAPPAGETVGAPPPA